MTKDGLTVSASRFVFLFGDIFFQSTEQETTCTNNRNPGANVETTLPRLRQVEWREWWLWGFAVAVTLVLTFGILSLTFPGFHMANDRLYALSLKEWVRGLAALVLLFDIYTVYQHLQLQRMRRHLAERDRLFQLISENAADMIAVVDKNGRSPLQQPGVSEDSRV